MCQEKEQGLDASADEEGLKTSMKWQDRKKHIVLCNDALSKGLTAGY